MIEGGGFSPGGIYSGGGGDLIQPCKNRGDLFRGGGDLIGGGGEFDLTLVFPLSDRLCIVFLLIYLNYRYIKII